MAARFEIEAVIPGPRPFVIARLLEPAEVRLTERSMLGGVRVRAFDVPRALDSDGQQRQDVYGFALQDPAELFRLSVGSRVELVL